MNVREGHGLVSTSSQEAKEETRPVRMWAVSVIGGPRGRGGSGACDKGDSVAEQNEKQGEGPGHKSGR